MQDCAQVARLSASRANEARGGLKSCKPELQSAAGHPAKGWISAKGPARSEYCLWLIAVPVFVFPTDDGSFAMKNALKVLAAILALGSAQTAQAVPIQFRAILSGANEFPPTGSPGFGQ